MEDLSNENVIHLKEDNFEFLQFKRLLEYSNLITHGYSIGLEVNFRTNRYNGILTEEEKNIAQKSYEKMAASIKIDENSFVKPNQNHTKEVKCVEVKINENAPDFNTREYENTDGLITDKKGLNLVTTNADCILLLFFDPVKKVIANIHSGWKGTLQRISVVAVNKMIQNYGCNPEDIICCMCPSIRKCHFEVDEEVKNLFWNEFKELEEINQIIEENNGKWNIDTVLINRIILKRSGLKEENIIDSGICSVCQADKMHSFRVEKETYGLEAAVIGLK